MQTNEMINQSTEKSAVEETPKKKVWTAEDYRAMGYDEEDIALMLDEKLWAEIEATKDEECVIWYPGMFLESPSKRSALKKLTKRPRKFDKPSTKRSVNSPSTRTTTQM